MEGIAIVGSGRMGERRVRSVLASAALGERTRIVVCADRDADAANRLASLAGADATTSWRTAVERDDVTLVVVATPHDLLAEVAAAGAALGKHVLVEKPGGRVPADIDRIASAAAGTGACIRVGFNHRAHRALRQLRALVDADAIGPIRYLRGRYGHGGRPGYEHDWRADDRRSGGGQTIDQGAHLIDLSAWLLADVDVVSAATATYFWDMDVEDNVFLLLRSSTGQLAQLHASWTEWKNLFSLEVFGRDGKLEVTGLGGSYGEERLVLHRMTPEMGPPETTAWSFPEPDDSLERELSELLDDIALGRTPTPGLAEARTVLEIVQRARSPHSSDRS